jgi:hypothetical protein
VQELLHDKLLVFEHKVFVIAFSELIHIETILDLILILDRLEVRELTCMLCHISGENQANNSFTEDLVLILGQRIQEVIFILLENTE